MLMSFVGCIWVSNDRNWPERNHEVDFRRRAEDANREEIPPEHQGIAVGC